VSISMIDRVEFNAPGAGAKGKLKMTVGGPLHLDKGSRYEPPVTIKFVIIQEPKHEENQKQDAAHDPDEDKRVRGVATAAPNADRWAADVFLDPHEYLAAGAARGIAVAVMEKKGEYAFETLTWCDYVELSEFVEGGKSKIDGDPGSRRRGKWVVSRPTPPGPR
jgi:hypothetical protein